MFVLVSGRHVGAYPDGLQHGISIQISINLGKTFLRISCLRKIAVNWILARGFAYLPSFFSQILDFICWTVSIFVSIYFESRDTENQQFFSILRAAMTDARQTYLDQKWKVHSIKKVRQWNLATFSVRHTTPHQALGREKNYGIWSPMWWPGNAQTLQFCAGKGSPWVLYVYLTGKEKNALISISFLSVRAARNCANWSKGECKEQKLEPQTVPHTETLRQVIWSEAFPQLLFFLRLYYS